MGPFRGGPEETERQFNSIGEWFGGVEERRFRGCFESFFCEHCWQGDAQVAHSL